MSRSSQNIKDRLEALPSSSDNHKHSIGIRQPHNAVGSCLFGTKNAKDGKEGEVGAAADGKDEGHIRPDDEVRMYLHKLKKIMQSLSTQIVQLDMNDKTAVLEKGFSLQKRKGQTKKSIRNKRKKKVAGDGRAEHVNDDEEDVTNNVVAKHKMLKRKRFHNFTETVMGESMHR